MSDDDSIPCPTRYRKIGLHDSQSPARLKIVRAELDLLLDGMNDAEALADFASDPRHSPESRLTAAAKARALVEQAQAERRTVDVSLRKLDASIAGLNSKLWRSPSHYASDLDSVDDAVRREL